MNTTVNRETLVKKLFSLSPKVKESGFWTTKDGQQILVSDITDYHLQNIVNFINRVELKKAEMAEKEEVYVFNRCCSFDNPYSNDPYNGVFSMGEDPCDNSAFGCNDWGEFD